MRRRRRIIWCEEFVAKNLFNCNRCDTEIHPTYPYLRIVLADDRHMYVEREHATPNCPPRCF